MSSGAGSSSNSLEASPQRLIMAVSPRMRNFAEFSLPPSLPGPPTGFQADRSFPIAQKPTGRGIGTVHLVVLALFGTVLVDLAMINLHKLPR